MKGRVIITEKKDVADAMAKAMKWRAGQGGYEGTFEGAPVKVVWARGHLLTMQSPEEIDPTLGWNDPERLAPIPRAVKMKIIEEPGVEEFRSIKGRMNVIKAALANADEVILATDSDREGEYIGWSILEYFNWRKPVRRCWLASGMDETSMTQAMKSLLPASDKKSLARAAEARARCDWAYMYIVRLLTFYGRRGLLGSHLGTGAGRESVVSIGRVQSAALYMIFKREMEIRHFVPKTFYKINAEFLAASVLLNAEYRPKVTREIIERMPEGVTWEPQGLEGEGKMDKPLFTGVEQVKAFRKRLLDNAAAAVVEEYSEGTKEQHPPITFDLVAAKSALSGACKINGDVAQVVIEDLYEQGFISYPRTAHGELPMNMYAPAERDSRLRCVAGLPGLTAAANKALAIHNGKDADYKPFKPKVFVNKKLEHFGLIPSQKTVNASVLASMSPKKRVNNKTPHTAEHMRVAYQLIAERFVQAMLPPVKLATQKITFRVPTQDMLGHPTSLFVANAERTVDPGWKAIMNAGGDKANELPRLKNGTSAPLQRVTMDEGQTKAPSRYSEKNFERAMQSAAREVNDPELRKYLADGTNKPEGIGTPATRKDIIPTLKVRNYIRADKSNTFFLEAKGEELINYLMKNGHHQMYRIETTAQWEGKLSDMTELEDDLKASKMRDEFIEETLCDIERFIREVNDTYRGQESKAVNRAPSAVTPRMKEVIKNIATRKGIKPPPGTLTDPAKAQAFLNEHIPKKDASEGATSSGSSGSSFAPSEAQLNLLNKIEEAAGVKATQEERNDRAKLSAFIDKHKGAMSAQPPSEKMLKWAKDIAAKLPEDKKPKPEVFTRMDACRKFIDQHVKKK